MITIKPTSQSDLTFIMDLWNNGDVMKYIGFKDGLNITPTGINKWYQALLENDNEYHFSIYQNNDYCGETFYRYQHEKTTLDIKLLPNFQHKKIASYALSYCMLHVFMKDPTTICEVDPHSDNTDAIHLYLKLGFSKTNQQHDSQHYPNNFIYQCTYSDFIVDYRVLQHEVQLRPYHKDDDEFIYLHTAARNDYEWMDWDGPYFEKSEPLSFDQYKKSFERQRRLNHPEKTQVIVLFDYPLGMVNSYWEDEDTRWLEIGGIVFESIHWSKGYGTIAFKKWIQTMFELYPTINRVGLTTWSGNHRMMRTAQKLYMSLEARVRQVRYFQDVYYDSIKYGITREEYSIISQWEITTIKNPQEINDFINHQSDELIKTKLSTYLQNQIVNMDLKLIKDLGYMVISYESNEALEIVLISYQQRNIGTRRILEAKRMARVKGYSYLKVKLYKDDNLFSFYNEMGFKKVESCLHENNPYKLYLWCL